MRTTCPHCRSALSIPDQLASRDTVCGECGAAFRAGPFVARKPRRRWGDVIAQTVVLLILVLGGAFLALLWLLGGVEGVLRFFRR
jgi:hypothetical protein